MKQIQRGPFYSTERFTSGEGVEFISFAKSRRYERELYEDLVAPYFNSGDYYVESWRHGKGNLPSNCTKSSKVYNIESLRFQDRDGVSFDTMKDHSKWLINRDRGLICVGDINRQEHQLVRGGGTVCTTGLQKIATLYNGLIKDVEPCRRRSNEVHHSNSNNKKKNYRTFS
jgi:deoxyribonuclease II